MKKVKKRRKKKIKIYHFTYEFKKFLAYFSFFLFLTYYGISNGIQIKKEMDYKETYEYKLLEKGYKKKETDLITKKLKDKDIDKILEEEEKSDIYYNILKQKYYIDKYYDKYVEYKTYHEEESYEDVIAIINTHINEGWYNKTFDSNLDDGYEIIVNKFYHLPKDYKRNDIVPINLQTAYANQSASKVVVDAYYKMHDDILKELGVHLMVNSSFRSYEDQEDTYNLFKNSRGQRYADTYAARPGYSEHQTGLALDLTSLENPLVDNFEKSKEYEWLKENCYKYGFILRYPKGKNHITGYNNESWHFRYVGLKTAKIIKEKNITFDEYYAYYIENK